MPLMLLLEGNRGDGAQKFPFLPEGVFPLFPQKAFNTSSICLPKRNCDDDSEDSLTRRTVSIKIRQFPVIHASTSTVYKLQGETIDNLVVCDWKAGNCFIDSPEQIYLMLSRARKRQDVICLRQLTEYLIKWSAPSREVLLEECRLLALHKATLETNNIAPHRMSKDFSLATAELLQQLGLEL